MTAESKFQHEREMLGRSAASVRWWPPALGFLVVGVAYALLSEELTVGSRWVLLVVGAVAVVGTGTLRWRGLVSAGRWLAIAGLVGMTTALTVSVAYLLLALLQHTADATTLLQGGALLWASNIVTFGLWYWEVDAGGPTHRHATHCSSTDFAFPQTILGDGQKPVDWLPEFLDYVFLAFNTSTAFSPTDTMVLARRAKLMMMYQSVVSLIVVAVLVAKAINSL